MSVVRIATRESKLALWQANHVKDLIESAHPQITCEIMGMTTLGDRNKTSPLSTMGGKGVFVKELETALIDGSADIAVHSMKDVPGVLPAGLCIRAICERASPHDALVSNHFGSLQDLPAGARIGSSSLRRVLQLRAAFPALEFAELRGNVDTRLKKLDDGDFDAIILAVAGLTRLGLAERVRESISSVTSIPAAGQGAVGIEARVDDERIGNILQAVNHEASELCVSAERRVTQALEATCDLPVAVYASLGKELTMSAFLSNTSGSQMIRANSSGEAADYQQVADTLYQQLVDQGASELLAE